MRIILECLHQEVVLRHVVELLRCLLEQRVHLVDEVDVFKLDFIIIEQRVEPIVLSNHQIALSVGCALFLGPLRFGLIDFLLFLALILSCHQLNLNIAILVPCKAAHHLVCIVMNIVNPISVHSGTSCQNLAGLGPLGLVLFILRKELAHIINADNSDQIDLKCVLLIDFLLLSKPDKLINSLHLLIGSLACPVASTLSLVAHYRAIEVVSIVLKILGRIQK